MEVETRSQCQTQEPGKNGALKPPSTASKLLQNPLLVVNFLLMVVGSAGGPLLLRAYFLHGGSRKWLMSLLQTAAWPLLLFPLIASFLSRRRGHNRGPMAAAVPCFFMTAQLLASSAAVGLLTGLDDLLYAYGLAYLPVSTSSLLISTQLVFTAAFALLLVRQRFTAFSVNAVVLLSVGAAMLGLNAGGDRPAGVSRVRYCAGFAMTLAAAALYGIVLPVMELSQARHAARAGKAVTYTVVMEMQLVIGLVGTAFSAVGMLVNNDFHAIPIEAREFGLGKVGYYLLLVGAATMYQCFFLGTIGAVFYGSALLAGVVMTMLIPVTEVLAVIFFREPFNGTKGVALALSLWGFVSYFYGEVQAVKESNKPQNQEHFDP